MAKKETKIVITYVLMVAGLFPLGIIFMFTIYNYIAIPYWSLSRTLGDLLNLMCGGIGITLFVLGFVLWMLID